MQHRLFLTTPSFGQGSAHIAHISVPSMGFSHAARQTFLSLYLFTSLQPTMSDTDMEPVGGEPDRSSFGSHHETNHSLSNSSPQHSSQSHLQHVFKCLESPSLTRSQEKANRSPSTMSQTASHSNDCCKFCISMFASLPSAFWFNVDRWDHWNRIVLCFRTRFETRRSFGSIARLRSCW